MNKVMEYDSFAQPLPHPALPNIVWPEPIDYPSFEALQLSVPGNIVKNLLDVGSRMIFGGGSKTFKTWAMCDMAMSVAAGVPFWGFPTNAAASCLYVNFELKEFHMRARLRAIRLAKKINQPLVLWIWNLRGYEIPLESFKAELIKRISQYHAVAVFIDPFYKLLGSRDERVSAEINAILGVFDEINRLTGSSIVCAAHFTKGNQAAKEAIDRISGGGSINRDPDNLVTLTKHETELAFSVEFTLRDFAPLDPFVVRWDYPLLVRTDLDPDKIKKPGRPLKASTDELVNIIKVFDDQLSTDELLEKSSALIGWSRATFFRRLDELKKSKAIFLSLATDKWNLKPIKS